MMGDWSQILPDVKKPHGNGRHLARNSCEETLVPQKGACRSRGAEQISVKEPAVHRKMSS